MSGPELTLND